jgi:ABC-type nitrate/sulfonate/bicarbonate transport system substrate-binding protein
MTRIALAIAALLAAGAAPAAAQVALKASEPVRYFGNMPIYAAVEAGFFKQKGVSLELITMRGGPAAANALISGDVDLVTGALEQALKMKAKGQDVKVIASIQHKSPFAIVVPVDSPAKTLADLKGKTIGVTAVGSSSDVQLRGYIRQQGMDPEKDFQITGLGPSILPAFERGQIDAAIMLAPALTKVLADRKARAIADFRKEPYHTMAIIVRAADVTGPRAAQLKSVVQAMAISQKALYDDPGLAVRVAKAYFPDMDPALMEQMIKAEIRDFASFPKDAKVSREGFDNVVQTLIRIKELDKPIRYEDLVVTGFTE